MHDGPDPADPSDEGVFVHDGLTIPESEVRFVFSRSGGPGGQNVNKVNTRATLLFSLSYSAALSPDQAARIRERLASRIGSDGILRVVCQEHRTQMANRLAARKRFARLLAEALVDPPERRETRPPPKVRERRLQGKRHRAVLKRSRGTVWRDEE